MGFEVRNGKVSAVIWDERNQLQRGPNAGQSLRVLSRIMNRSPGALSRKCRRGGSGHSYGAVHGRDSAQTPRRHGPRKLLPGSPLTGKLHALILQRSWSPEQIGGMLRVEHPDDSSQRVSHETIASTSTRTRLERSTSCWSMRYGRFTRNGGPGIVAKTTEGASGTCAPSGNGLRKSSPEKLQVTKKETSSRAPSMGAPSAPWRTAARASPSLAKVEDSSAEAVLEGCTRRLHTLRNS